MFRNFCDGCRILIEQDFGVLVFVLPYSLRIRQVRPETILVCVQPEGFRVYIFD